MNVIILSLLTFLTANTPQAFAYDRHQIFPLESVKQVGDCAKQAVEAAIQASQFPQIKVADFRESQTFATTVNRRDEHYFEFTGSDSEAHSFTGYVLVTMKPVRTEEPLSGKRTSFIACFKSYNILSPNLVINNINKTAIIVE